MRAAYAPYSAYLPVQAQAAVKPKVPSRPLRHAEIMPSEDTVSFGKGEGAVAYGILQLLLISTVLGVSCNTLTNLRDNYDLNNGGFQTNRIPAELRD